MTVTPCPGFAPTLVTVTVKVAGRPALTVPAGAVVLTAMSKSWNWLGVWKNRTRNWS